MSVSQNGWPVVDKDACDQGPFHGVSFPNGILAGDVATIARWQLSHYAAMVEPLIAGSCWGWFVKQIEGTTQVSNHSSATAWDINASLHPMGVATSRTMQGWQIEACHAIEAASQGTLRWGGDFGRPDPMHWEIIGTRSQVAAFARYLRTKEETMDDATIAKLANAIGEAVVDKLLTHNLGRSGPTVGVVLQSGVYQNGGKIIAQLQEITDLLTPAVEPTNPL